MANGSGCQTGLFGPRVAVDPVYEARWRLRNDVSKGAFEPGLIRFRTCLGMPHGFASSILHIVILNTPRLRLEDSYTVVVASVQNPRGGVFTRSREPPLPRSSVGNATIAGEVPSLQLPS